MDIEKIGKGELDDLKATRKQINRKRYIIDMKNCLEMSILLHTDINFIEKHTEVRKKGQII